MERKFERNSASAPLNGYGKVNQTAKEFTPVTDTIAESRDEKLDADGATDIPAANTNEKSSVADTAINHKANKSDGRDINYQEQAKRESNNLPRDNKNPNA